MKRKVSEIVKSVKTKIRWYMEKEGMTQQKLADKMETSQQKINNLLNNNKDIKLTDMEKAAQALNVGIEKILPQNIIQNNYEGTNDIAQNITINDREIIEKIIEGQSTMNELVKELIVLVYNQKK